MSEQTIRPYHTDARHAELARLLQTVGGRVVSYRTCCSFLIGTVIARSEPVHLPPGRSAWLVGLPFSVLSLLVGWWAVPFGFWYTPWSVWFNCRGGEDVTDDYRADPRTEFDA